MRPPDFFRGSFLLSRPIQAQTETGECRNLFNSGFPQAIQRRSLIDQWQINLEVLLGDSEEGLIIQVKIYRICHCRQTRRV